MYLASESYYMIRWLDITWPDGLHVSAEMNKIFLKSRTAPLGEARFRHTVPIIPTHPP